MENKKYHYELNWTQSYNSLWPSDEWLSLVEEEILENKLQDSNMDDSKNVIKKIMNL